MNDDRTAAFAYANGTTIPIARVEVSDEYKEMMSRLSLLSSEHLQYVLPILPHPNHPIIKNLDLKSSPARPTTTSPNQSQTTRANFTAARAKPSVSPPPQMSAVSQQSSPNCAQQ
jgi:hypothetical protein